MSSSDHPKSENKPMFCMAQAVYVRIDKPHNSDLNQKFMRFCIDNKIYGFRGGSSGPKGLVGWYYPDQAEKIREFLAEHATEYDWETGEEKTDA